MPQGSAAGGEGVDASLLATLKTLRCGSPRNARWPAYVVFSDRTLIGMAERQQRVVPEGDDDRFFFDGEHRRPRLLRSGWQVGC